jgi:MinD-like ATPase involved in chromosome partitioning or flagellar assembly
MNEGVVVTFYSFKGGVGRSFLLANVGTLLAQWGHRVLCIDWDLEAPGLAQYYSEWSKPNERGGLLEFVEDFSRGAQPTWKDYLTTVEIPEASAPLRLLAAGRRDESYVTRVQGVDWAGLYEQKDFGSFLEGVRTQWKEEFDFILIDSRTGITDVGGICTVHLPDLLTFVFTANHQSLDGAIDVVERAIAQRNRLPFDRAGLLALPVPSRLSSREERDLTEKWLKIFAERLEPFYKSWLHRDVSIPEILDQTKIPYFTYWSFGERLPVVEERRSDPESISFNIATISALLAHRLAGSERLIKTRDLLLADARAARTQSSSVEDSTRYDIFLSYANNDRKFASELASRLEDLGLRTFFNEDDLTPDASGFEALSEALQNSRHKVFLLGRRINVWQEHELYSALRSGISEQSQGLIIPVLLSGSDIEKIPKMIFQFKNTKVFARYESVERLASDIALSVQPG